MARIYGPGIRSKLPKNLKAEIAAASANVKRTSPVTQSWIVPFWGANSKRLMAWARIHAFNFDDKQFRPFSCRINISGEISWITVTDVMMPDSDDVLGEPLLRYETVDKYFDRVIRMKYAEKLVATKLFSIEHLVALPTYELQKLAEHMESFTL